MEARIKIKCPQRGVGDILPHATKSTESECGTGSNPALVKKWDHYNNKRKQQKKKKIKIRRKSISLNTIASHGTNTTINHKQYCQSPGATSSPQSFTIKWQKFQSVFYFSEDGVPSVLHFFRPQEITQFQIPRRHHVRAKNDGTTALEHSSREKWTQPL